MALKQQIEQQIIEEIKSKFSLPVKNTNTANGSNGSVKGYPTNSDDIFKGDE